MTDKIINVGGKDYKVTYEGSLTDDQISSVTQQIRFLLQQADPLYPVYFSPEIIAADIAKNPQVKTLSPGANPSIVSGVTTGYLGNGSDEWFEFLMTNKASMGYTQGVVKYLGSKYDNNVCYQDPTNQNITCIPTTAYNLKILGKVLVNLGLSFNFGCVETFTCMAGEDCTNKTCTTFNSTHTSFEWQIPIRAYNISPPTSPTGLVITPGSGVLTISWNSVADPTGGGEVFAYYIRLTTGGNIVVSGYTEAGLRNVTIGGLANGTAYNVEVIARSQNGIGGPATTGTGTPGGGTQAGVFNICWKVGLPTTGYCAQPPDQPPITPGTSFIIKADIRNSGPTGKVRAVIKDGSTVISDQQNPNLGTYPGGGLWSPYITYTMPNRNVTLIVDAYGWDGTNWILTETRSSTISMSTPTCTHIDLSPFTATVDRGGTVNFTATATPSTAQLTVNFKLRDGTILASRTTTGGIATYAWTAPSTEGTYYVHTEVGSPAQCTSTESVIQVSPPIRQWALDINVKDATTNAAISGASVTILTQTLQTDTSGHIQFMVNEGSVYVTISKSGYNTLTDSIYVFNNTSKIELLSPISTAQGSLRFITVPTASDVYFGTTLKGTTDPSAGTLTVSSLNAGTTISYTVKKTGYNDSTGTVTVVGGITKDVPVTLTLATPTTGGVCIKSNPPGASIFIDNNLTSKITTGENLGCTSQNIIDNLTPVNHPYGLTLIGYQDKTGNFTIIAGQTISVDAGTLTVSPNMGLANFASSPAGARIYIDGNDTGYATPGTVPNIPAGPHTYKLTLPRYKDATGTFNIVAEWTTYVPVIGQEIQMVLRVGNIRFCSTPGGANLSLLDPISGNIINVPLSGGVPTCPSFAGSEIPGWPIGPLSYSLKKTGYDDYNGNTVVVEGTTTDVSAILILSVSGKGSLHIETIPPGAKIFIDGIEEVGIITPTTITDIDVGGHIYELRLPRYYTISGTFMISGGQTTVITKTLQSTPPVQAGFGAAGMVLIAGLAVGALYIATRPKVPSELPTKELPSELSTKELPYK